MNLRKSLRLLRPESPETKKRKADEKRRRLSFLKGKHQEQYQPSEARLPRPKPPRPSVMETLKKFEKTTKTLSTRIQRQAKKMPSGKEMDDYVWGNSEKKKS